MKFKHLLLVLLSAGVGSAFAEGPAPEKSAEKPMLTSAIFVMNRAGKEYDAKLDVLNDMIATRLAEKGFSIIDKNEVLAKFREYREVQRPEGKESGVAVVLSKLAGEEPKEAKSLDELIDTYSAKKISTIAHADYIVIATINSVGRETRKGEAFGQKLGVVTTTLRVALKVLEGNLGGSVAGTMVEAKDSTPLMDGVQIENSDLPNQLLDQCALKVAEDMGSKTERVRSVVVKAASMVAVTVNSNIEGAEVSFDGIVYGTTPCKVMVPQGPASLKISRQWFKPIEKFINPFQGQQLNVTLELTDEGAKSWKDAEAFKLAMARERQEQELEKKEREAGVANATVQSEADAKAKVLVAEGEKKKREQSYVHDDGIGHEIKEIIHGNK